MPQAAKLLLPSAVLALFLFGFVGTRYPLDQDLGSKAAKIESLARQPLLTSPMHPPLYYRESYFAFYYQTQAAFRKLFPSSVSAVATTGYAAALCGLLYFAALAVYLNKLTGIGPWWSLFLFLNTPALVLNFLYGNEASMSLALVAVAAAGISLAYNWLPGVALGLAFFCRPDIVLLAPFILVLLGFHWRRILAVGLSAVFTASAYWLLAIREIPSEAGFPWIVDWRIFAVYLFFGFGPALTALALFGLFKKGWRHWLLPLSTLAPLLYYFRDLGSPKYILGLSFGTTLCSAWVIASAGRKLKAAIVLTAAVFWFVSFTPFGVFGPKRGGHWVAPAGHGPVVFGSYLSFYSNVHRGFFGVRYSALIQTWALVLQALKTDPRPLRVIGSSDTHMLNLLCEQRGFSSRTLPVSVDMLGAHLAAPSGRFIMLFNGYSRLGYLTAPGAEAQVRQWLAAGMVSAFPGDNHILPYVVEIGPTVAHGSKELAERILLADRLSGGGGIAPMLEPVEDYGQFSLGGAELWGNWWPAVYYRNHAAQAREALTGGRPLK